MYSLCQKVTRVSWLTNPSQINYWNIQSLKTADWIWFSLFMRSPPSPRLSDTLLSHKISEPTSPKEPENVKITLYWCAVRWDIYWPPYCTITAVVTSKFWVKNTKLTLDLPLVLSRTWCSFCLFYMSRVKRICVFEHSVMTNCNCACPDIQRG